MSAGDLLREPAVDEDESPALADAGSSCQAPNIVGTLGSVDIQLARFQRPSGSAHISSHAIEPHRAMNNGFGSRVAEKSGPSARDAVVGTSSTPPAAPPLVPSFEFSTLDLPAEIQFGAWCQNVASIVNLTDPKDCTKGFAGTQLVWDLGGLAFAHIKCDGLKYASLAARFRRNPIDHWLLTLMLNGRCHTETPFGSFDCHAGSVQVHSLGRSYEGFHTDAEMLVLVVPRDFCRDMVHVLDAAEFTAIGGGMGALLADYIMSLARQLPTLRACDAPKLAEATRAMILACVAPSPDKLQQAPVTVTLLERARRFVQANLFNPDLGSNSMQRELGLSRSRLYRLFEPSGGVANYIRHRRLLDAHAALADFTSSRRIVEIGEQYGFSSAADFSRAFKREFRYTPSEVRAGFKGSSPRQSSIDLDTIHPIEQFGALLHRLQA